MAQGRDTISQRITIDGAQDVINSLRSMGEAGERAIRSIQRAFEASGTQTEQVGKFTDRVREHFNHVREAAHGAGEQINRVGEAGHRFGESLNNVAEHVVPHWRTVMELATAGSVAAFVELTKRTAEYVVELHRTADEVGLSEQKWQEFNFVIRSTGVHSERVVSTFSRLNRAVGEAVTQSREHLGQLGLDLAKLSGDGNTFFDIVIRGASKVEDVKKQVVDFGGLKNSREELLRAARAIQRQERHEFEDVGADTRYLRPLDQILRSIAEAFTQLTPAASKARVELAKYTDLKVPLRSLDEVHEAYQSLGKDMDTLITRVLHVPLYDATGQIRELSEVFDDVGKSLSRLTDEGTKAYYAQLIFSRGFKEVLPLFNSNGAELAKLRKEWRELGVEISEVETGAVLNLYGSFAKLSITFDNLRGKMLAVFSPEIVEIINAITVAVNKSGQGAVEWARQLTANALPAVHELSAYIRGDLSGKDIKTEWVRQLINGFHEIRGAVVAVIGAARAVISVLDNIATVANATFGTNFTGMQIAAILLVGQLTGALGALKNAIELIFITISVLTKTNPWLWLLTAFIYIAAELYRNWDTVKANIQHALDGWVGLFKAAGSEIVAIWSWVKNSILEVLGLGQQARKEVGSVAAGGAGMSEGAGLTGGMAFTGGGPVPGSGSGDHVHIAAEPGEYVVRGSSVRQFGLAFFHALNQGILPRFSLGGLVNRLSAVSPAPLRMATGGLVPASGSPGRTFNLVIGEHAFRGLTAPEKTANAMVQYARTASIVSAGVRPSWDGSG